MAWMKSIISWINPKHPASDHHPTDNSSALHELLQCHVCNNFMYPPIHQCRNGHTLCSACKIGVHNECPACRQEFGEIRCIPLEKLAESLQMHCKYLSSGCQEIVPYCSKLEHEARCNFRPYHCPYSSECSIVGDIPFLVSHLKNDHKAEEYERCEFQLPYVEPNNLGEFTNGIWSPAVYRCFGQYFCLQFEAFNISTTTPSYMASVHFMGEEDGARKFRYRLKVGADGRKQTWEGTPRSIRDSHQKVRDSNDALIISRNIALSFSDGDAKKLNLIVKGRIWKVKQKCKAGCA